MEDLTLIDINKDILQYIFSNIDLFSIINTRYILDLSYYIEFWRLYCVNNNILFDLMDSKYEPQIKILSGKELLLEFIYYLFDNNLLDIKSINKEKQISILTNFFLFFNLVIGTTDLQEFIMIHIIFSI